MSSNSGTFEPVKTCKFNHIIKSLLPKGYSLFHVPRTYSTGGGVAIVYKDCITVKPQISTKFNSFEYMECLVKLGNNWTRVVAIYRPPPSQVNGFTVKQFINEFTQLLEILVVSQGQLLILGDFNFHLDKLYDCCTKQFLDMLSLFNLTQHVSGPTHNLGSTLDLVITRSNEDLLSNINVCNPFISDHYAVVFNLRHKKVRYRRENVSYRPYKSIDEDSFIRDVSDCLVTPVLSYPNVDHLFSIYNNCLSSLIDHHAPIRTKTITIRPDAPWYNNAITQAKRLRRSYEHKWLRSKTLDSSDYYELKYRDQCTIVNNLVLKSKCDFYNGKVQAAKGDQKELFKLVNNIFHNNSKQAMPSHDSLEQLSNMFSDFYVTKIEKIRADISSACSDGAVIEGASASHELFSVDIPLIEFYPASVEEIREIIASSPNKSCDLDPIPTWLLKKCGDPLVYLITEIVNMSLSSAHMPNDMKKAILTPIIKKLFLDPEVLNNFRPISNLSFVSKIIEKVVASRLIDHMSLNGLDDAMQSAYKKFHSTESALINIFDDVLSALDLKKLAMLIMQDLSAAFDTVDHEILLNRLEKRLGIKGKALAWFKSYLSNRTQSVRVNGTFSDSKSLKFGVPQGSVLGPILFNIYTLPLGDILRKHDIPYHFYADDSQEYAFFEVQDYTTTALKMENAVHDIRVWYSQNFLKSNDDKTDVIILFSKFCPSFYKFPIAVGEILINPSTKVKNLGVTIDQNLNMEKHVNNVVSTAFLKLRELYFYRRYLTKDSLVVLVHAFITSRVDYCNSLLTGLPSVLLRKLQSVLNASARLISGTRKFDHITHVLKDLHWLPIKQRIKFKLMLTVFKCLNGSAPMYLQKKLNISCNPKLRSSNKKLLIVPKSRTKIYGDRRFSVSGPRQWNLLPKEIRLCNSIDNFKSKLKTFLFTEAYSC